MHELTFGSGPVGVRRLNVSEDAAADLAAHTMLVYTGQSHFSSQTHDRVWGSYAAGDRSVTASLLGIKDVAARTSAIIEAGDWRGLAELIDENWSHQKYLDATICTPGMQAVEDAVRAAGAWGIKATGAGAGGSLVLIADPTSHLGLKAAVEALGARVLDFAFADEGVRVREADDDDSAD